MNSELARRIAALTPEQRRALSTSVDASRSEPDSEVSAVPRGIAPSPCEASSNQRYLWLLDQRLPGGNPGWNVFTGAHVIGALDRDAIHRGLLAIGRRHEILRTTLSLVDGKLMQIVSPEIDISMPIVDLGELSPEQRRQESRAQITEFYRRKFDLSKGPLVRPVLFRLGDHEHQLLVIMHHTITDWISFGLLNQELARLYAGFVTRTSPQLPADPIQYRDYAYWEKNWENTAPGQRQLGYWRQRLAGIPRRMPLPWDYVPPSVQSAAGARVPVSLPAHESAALRRSCRQAGVSPFVAILAAFKLILARFSNCFDVVVGSPVIGRTISGTDHGLGLYLNHVALRTDVSGQIDYPTLLERVTRTVMEAYANQQIPFGRVATELNPDLDPGFTPLFQVMFFFLAEPVIHPFLGLQWKNLEAYGETSRYDLLLSLWERADGISGVLEYNTSLFSSATVAGVVRAIERVLTLLATDFNRPYQALHEAAEPSPIEHEALRAARSTHVN